MEDSSVSPVFDLVLNQDLEAVQTYLNQCPPSVVNAGDDDDRTLLHLAVEINNLDIVKCLIGHGADVNKRTIDLRLAPLHLSVMNGHIPMTELLLLNGADINIRNKIDLSPLQLAIIRNNVDMVNLLLGKGGDPNTVTRDRRTETPLLKASTMSLQLTTLLINSGAIITPFLKEILVALLANKPDIASYLIDIVMERKKHNHSPYDFVLRPNSIGKSHLQALCSHVTNCDPQLAVGIMDKLIKLGDNINYANHFGSLFHILIFRTEKDEVARALFDHLISLDDVNCNIFVYTSGQAMTPLTDAMQIGQFYFADRLVIDGFVDVATLNLDHFRFTPESLHTLKLLHYLGYRFPNNFLISNRPSSDTHDELFAEFCSWIESESNNVMNLKNLIRIHMRKRYGRKVSIVVSNLPDLIKKFLLLN